MDILLILKYIFIIICIIWHFSPKGFKMSKERQNLSETLVWKSMFWFNNYLFECRSKYEDSYWRWYGFGTAGWPLMQTKQHKIPQDSKLFLISPCRWKTKEAENGSTKDIQVPYKIEACALYLLSKERTVTKKSG